MVAYSNRFLTIAGRIRKLYETYQSSQDKSLREQITRLRVRLHLIKKMQALGVACLISCVTCMLVLFTGYIFLAEWIFGFALILLLLSLVFSFREVLLSVEALNLALSDMENYKKD